MSRFDVVIVGAGPAGLAAALTLAPSLSVLLLERQAFPPHKPCGDLLVEEGMQRIEPFSPPRFLFLDSRPIDIQFVDRDNGVPGVPMMPAHRIDRSALSHWLLSLQGDNVTLRDRSRCVAVSVDVRGVHLAVRTNDGSLEGYDAGLLIGADGATSIVRRHLTGGAPPHIHAVQELYDARKSLPHVEFLFDKELAPDYYLWAIPRPGGRVLVGCPYQHGEAGRTFEWARSEYELTLPALQREVHPITRIESIEQCVLGRDRILLVGEAAGLVRPTSGEGISLALGSGMNAARAVNESPEAPMPAYRERSQPLLATLSRELQMAELLRSPQKRLAWLNAASRPDS